MLIQQAFALISLIPGSVLALTEGGLHPVQLAQASPGNLPQTLEAPSLTTTLENFGYWQALCRLQVEAEKYVEAQAACAAALQLRPQEPDLWTTQSSLLLALAQYPEAIAAAQQALTLNSDNALKALALAHQCRAYLELRQPDQALDLCQQALKLTESGDEASLASLWLYQGRALAQQQDFEAALVAYERALLFDRQDAQVLTYRCQAYLDLKQYGNALESCEAALDGNSSWGSASPALAWSLRGMAYRELGQLVPAVAAFDQALTLNPADAPIWLAQGQALEALGRSEEALLSYNRAVALQPDWPQARAGQCALLNQTAEYEAALAACEQALAGNGDWGAVGAAAAWSQQAQAYLGLDQPQAALAAINRAVGLNSEYAAAWNNRGAILARLENWQGAIASLQRATELDPTYASPWINVGRIQRLLGQYEAALTAYDQAIALDPNDAETWANRSVVQWYLKQHEAALESADRAIALDERTYLGWYNRATALVSLERYPEAGRAYQQAIRISPDSADAWTGMGVVLSRLNRYDEARQVLAKALELNPQQGVAQAAWRALPPLIRPSQQ
ncbi:MAG: tetratricopeptide repeat protein [Cyanobacteria bacterium Co-bin13]|nr:tetratricopeptide repeat protein [Cyanobacteria bacterium Co-bin13]